MLHLISQNKNLEQQLNSQAAKLQELMQKQLTYEQNKTNTREGYQSYQTQTSSNCTHTSVNMRQGFYNNQQSKTATKSTFSNSNHTNALPKIQVKGLKCIYKLIRQSFGFYFFDGIALIFGDEPQDIANAEAFVGAWKTFFCRNSEKLPFKFHLRKRIDSDTKNINYLSVELVSEELVELRYSERGEKILADLRKFADIDEAIPMEWKISDMNKFSKPSEDQLPITSNYTRVPRK